MYYKKLDLKVSLVNLMKGNCTNEDAETWQYPASIDCKYSMQKDVKVTGNRFLIPLDALKNLHSRTSCLQYFLGWYPDDQRSSSPLHDTHLGVRAKISCIKRAQRPK